MSMSANSSTNTSSGSTPANSDGGGDAIGGSTPTSGRHRHVVAPEDLVQRGALGRRPAGAVGRGDQIGRVELDAVIAAGHARDRLLHERPAQVVDGRSEEHMSEP